MPKNYILRNVDEELWRELKSAASLQGVSVRQVFIASAERFVQEAKALRDRVHVDTLDKQDS